MPPTEPMDGMRFRPIAGKNWRSNAVSKAQMAMSYGRARAEFAVQGHPLNSLSAAVRHVNQSHITRSVLMWSKSGRWRGSQHDLDE